MQKQIETKQKIYSLIIAAFLWAVATAQIAYIQSTYLSQFFSLEIVSILFFLAYLATFLVMNYYPNLIARFNNLKTVLTILSLEIICFLVYITSTHPIFIALVFIIYIICNSLVFINFDIFLEAYTNNFKTGRIRGIYFTIYNLGWVISPIITGQILSKLNFNWLFLFAIILIIPIILILSIAFKNFTNHYSHQRYRISTTIKKVISNRDLEKIFYVALLLEFFYAIMVIYTPIYLNQYMHLGWDQIGLIFTIMLLPFVILEYPAGYLADKYIGEKEILTAGLIFMIIASLIIFYLPSQSLIFWALILCLSRIGASLVEIMRESYFFKKVDVQNIELINAFRSTIPLAYILAPLIAAAVLYFLPINYLYLVLAGILLSGLYFSLTLNDTK